MRKWIGPDTWDKVILCDCCEKEIMGWIFSYEPYDVLTVRSKKGTILHYCSEVCCKKHHRGKGEVLVKCGEHPRDRKWIPLNLLV